MCVCQITIIFNSRIEIPDVLLTYDSKQYSLFLGSDDTTSPTLFTDRAAIIDEPIENFLLALQENFGLRTDVALFFPSLNLKLVTGVVHAKVTLVSFSYC